jgi:Flp pilus assembly pilin Flp
MVLGITSFVRDEAGETAIEFAFVASRVAALIVIALVSLGTSINVFTR